MNERPLPCEICAGGYPLKDDIRRDEAAKIIRDRIKAYNERESEKKERHVRNDAKEREEIQKSKEAEKSRRGCKHDCKSADHNGYCSICKKPMVFTWVDESIGPPMTQDQKVEDINIVLQCAETLYSLIEKINGGRIECVDRFMKFGPGDTLKYIPQSKFPLSIIFQVESFNLNYYGPAGESLADIFNYSICIEHPIILPITVEDGDKSYILFVEPHIGRVDIKIIDPQFKKNSFPVEDRIAKVINEVERYSQSDVKYEFEYQDSWIRSGGPMTKTYMGLLAATEELYPDYMNNIMFMTIASLLVSGTPIDKLYEIAWNLSDPDLLADFLITPVDRLYVHCMSTSLSEVKKLSEYNLL